MSALMSVEVVPCHGSYLPTSDSRADRHLAIKLLCSKCPVVEACAEAGKAASHGVWGGKDRTRTKRRKADAGIADLCAQGHLLTPDNAYHAKGRRKPKCVICARAYSRAYYLRKKKQGAQK